MRKAALTLVALAGICCSSKQENPVQPAKPNEVIEIPANECREVCGGKICYEDIIMYLKPKMVRSYTIASEGFDNYTTLNERMIFADKCIFYKLSAKSDKLIIEKLR